MNTKLGMTQILVYSNRYGKTDIHILLCLGSTERQPVTLYQVAKNMILIIPIVKNTFHI